MADPPAWCSPTESGTGVTSALGRAVVADALRAVDPIGAQAAERETDWRRAYLVHFRRLVEAGLGGGDAARRIAGDGLAALHRRMEYAKPGGGRVPLAEAFAEGTGSTGANRRSPPPPWAATARWRRSSACPTAASGCAAPPSTGASTPGSPPA